MTANVIRLDVDFAGYDGTALRGWLYLPDVRAPVPGVVMSHGFSATMAMGLVGYAHALAAAGMAVLAYDHRCFGNSAGEPRQLVDPWVQTRDMGCAVDWLAARAEIDPSRLALWGTSYSGGEAFALAALDSRVVAVAGVVPNTGSTTAAEYAESDVIRSMQDRIASAVVGQYGLAPPRPVVAVGQEGSAMIGDEATADWLLGHAHAEGSGWRNHVVVPAGPGPIPFNPAVALRHLQVPVLVVAGSEDHLLPACDAVQAIQTTGVNAQFVMLDGHHCSFFAGQPFLAASQLVCEFFAAQFTRR